jgi:hypothetical protein
MKTKFFLTGLVLMATTMMMNGQTPGNKATARQGTCNGATYVDTNKNGVCDNNEKRATTVSVKKGKGKGKCNGNAQGKGKNYTDANKNGICDIREANKK